MTRLVLLRHGRTAWNHARRVQGQLDAPLDATGLAQAETAAAALVRYEPAVIWSSDLSRAAVTADAVAAACGGLPVTRDTRLRERHFGERQGMTHDEWEAAAPEEFAAYRAGDYGALATGEKVSDVAARAVEVLHDLVAATPEGGTALAVAHGGTVVFAVAGLLGLGVEGAGVLRGLDNCHWAELTVDDSGRGRLVAYNVGA